MNYFFTYGCVLAITSTLFLTGCKKDATEPADAFVGNYSYTMTTSFIGSENEITTGNVRIQKVSEKKISLTQFVYGGSPIITYTVVSPTSIKEDSGHTTMIQIPNGKLAIFEENSTGDLQGNTLKISGTNSCEGYDAIGFELVLVRK
jgi:hypothetical protein